MAKYIDADKLLAEAKALSGPITGDGWDNWGVYALIERQPAADVRKNVRGKWVTKEYMLGDPAVGIKDMWVDRLAEPLDYYAHCSNCNSNALYNSDGELVLSDVCPWCGARMRGENDEG